MTMKPSKVEDAEGRQGQTSINEDSSNLSGASAGEQTKETAAPSSPKGPALNPRDLFAALKREESEGSAILKTIQTSLRNLVKKDDDDQGPLKTQEGREEAKAYPFDDPWEHTFHKNGAAKTRSLRNRAIPNGEAGSYPFDDPWEHTYHHEPCPVSPSGESTGSIEKIIAQDENNSPVASPLRKRRKDFVSLKGEEVEAIAYPFDDPFEHTFHERDESSKGLAAK